MAGMTERERAIREARANIYSGMVPLMQKVNDGIALTVEERKTFDDREAELQTQDEALKLFQRAQAISADRDDLAASRGVSRDELEGESRSDVYKRAYENWFKRGMDGISPEDRAMLMEQRDTDTTALSTTAGTATGQAGYLIPQGFWENLQIALKAYGGLLQLCNIIKTDSGNLMPWPTHDPTSIVGSYIGENTQLAEQGYAFGQGQLNAWTMTSNVVRTSLQFLNDSAFDVNSFITERMGESIGRLIAQELWAGSGPGSQHIVGLTTAVTANAGSGTGGGYVQPANGETVPTLKTPAGTASLAGQLVSFDSILKMIAGVDPAYRAAGSCNWVMNDAQLQRERSITDTQGHPLWQPNPQVGGQDPLYGYPVVIDNNAPGASTTGGTAGGLLFGDISRALVVRQVNNAGSMRLTERYADYLQVGFLSWVRMDSQANDLRAIKVYKCPAS